jgi:hypothetical protein
MNFFMTTREKCIEILNSKKAGLYKTSEFYDETRTWYLVEQIAEQFDFNSIEDWFKNEINYSTPAIEDTIGWNFIFYTSLIDNESQALGVIDVLNFGNVVFYACYGVYNSPDALKDFLDY